MPDVTHMHAADLPTRPYPSKFIHSETSRTSFMCARENGEVFSAKETTPNGVETHEKLITACESGSKHYPANQPTSAPENVCVRYCTIVRTLKLFETKRTKSTLRSWGAHAPHLDVYPTDKKNVRTRGGKQKTRP